MTVIYYAKSRFPYKTQNYLQKLLHNYTLQFLTLILFKLTPYYNEITK